MISRRTVIGAGVVAAIAVVLRQSWMTFKPRGNMTNTDINTHPSETISKSPGGGAPFAPVSVDLSYGVAPTGAGEGEGAMLQPTGAGLTLITFEYYETHPAIREVSIGSRITRLTLPPTATDVRVPQRNSPFFDELRRHVVWRDGRVVKTLVNTGEEYSLTAPFEVAELVAPALKTTGGPVEVLALASSRRQLALLRFFEAEPPVLAWTLDLPVTAAAVGFALGPSSGGNERHLAVIGESSSGGLTLATSHFGANPPAPMSVRSIDGLRPVAHARPGVAATVAGEVTVGILVHQAEGSLGLFETRIAADARTAPRDATLTAGPFGEPPTGGAVLYSLDPDGGIGRRDAAILLRGGSLIRIGPDGTAAPANAQGPIFDQVNLGPGRQGPFVLFVDPNTGPRLEAF